MSNQLMSQEVHAIVKSLHDLYVNEGVGHGDLCITIEQDEEGRTTRVAGFVVEFDLDSVTLGVRPNNRHVRVPFEGATRVTIER